MKKSNLSLLVFFSLTSCIYDKFDPKNLTVHNLSTEPIYSILSSDDSMFGSGYYSEFEINNTDIRPEFKFTFSEIKPFAEDYQHDRPRSWEDFFDESPDKKVRLYIVEKDTVIKYGWAEVFRQKIYSKKYNLSVSDLEEKNWNLEYRNFKD